MFDLSVLAVIAVFILLIIIALMVLLKLLSTGDEWISARQTSGMPVPMDEKKFVYSFLKPLYEDGLDLMDNAVESIRNGSGYYGHRAYAEAGEEFIVARRDLEDASRKFREVLVMVEDPETAYVKAAKGRLVECKQLSELAKGMEDACDAMLEGRKDDAQAAADRVSGVRTLAEEWSIEARNVDKGPAADVIEEKPS